jgi:hypothetical protein
MGLISTAFTYLFLVKKIQPKKTRQKINKLAHNVTNIKILEYNWVTLSFHTESNFW